MTALKHIQPADLDKEVATSKIPMIIDFWAEWCEPCRRTGPKFEEISKSYEGKVQFAKFDVQQDDSVPARYEIPGIPCMIVFFNGKEVDRISGDMPIQILRQKIEEALKKAK